MSVASDDAEPHMPSSGAMLRWLASPFVTAARIRGGVPSFHDLSRAQILDAGLCLTKAGRGKAADVDPVAQTILLSLR